MSHNYKTDQEWKDSLKNITTAEGILREILENLKFFGHDPYYADLKDAMVDRAEEILEASKATSLRPNDERDSHD